MSAPVEIRLVLPIPPSLNGAYANAPGRGRVATTELRQWKEAAGWKLKSQRPGAIGGQYHFALYLPHNMRGDLDNRIKAASDLMKEHGVIVDDRYAMSVRAERSEAVRAGECVVVLAAA